MKHKLQSSLCMLLLHCSKDDSLDKMLEYSSSAKMLYTRLLAKSVDTKDTQRWIFKPENGVSRPMSIEHWLLDDSSPASMNSKDLLKFYKPSTYRDALAILIKANLVYVDKFNRMHINYPFDGKTLSLVYAIKSIKSSYKGDEKDEAANSNDEQASQEETVCEPSEDKQFWN